MRFSDRPTTDVLLLIIAGTICFVIVGSTVTIAVIQIRDPGSDTSAAGNAIGAVINTLLGLLAGFLAGRTESGIQHRRRVEEREE